MIAYATLYPPAATAVAYKVEGAGRDFAGDEMACFAEDVPFWRSWISTPGWDAGDLVRDFACDFILAAEG